MMKTKRLFGRNYVWETVTYLILFLMIVIAIFPSIWMLSTSIKDVTELYDIPPEIIPDAPTVLKYVNVLQNSKMYQAFFNSVVITVSVVLLTLLFSLFA